VPRRTPELALALLLLAPAGTAAADAGAPALELLEHLGALVESSGELVGPESLDGPADLGDAPVGSADAPDAAELPPAGEGEATYAD
jgi:hypothetical protein